MEALRFHPPKGSSFLNQGQRLAGRVDVALLANFISVCQGPSRLHWNRGSLGGFSRRDGPSVWTASPRQARDYRDY